MKKFFSVFAVVCMLAVCLTAFAACATDVEGKTFMFDSYDIDFSDEAKEMAEEMGMDLDKFAEYMLGSSEEMMKQSGYKFEDGKIYSVSGETEILIGEYTQDGKDIIVGGKTIATASGGKLVIEQEDPDMGTMKVTFKQK